MTLKFVITAEEREALTDTQKELYVQNGEQWVLDTDDVEGHPRVRALKKAFEANKTELQKAQSAVPNKDDETLPLDERLSAAVAGRDKLIQQHQQEAAEWKGRAQDLSIRQEALVAVNAEKGKANLLLPYLTSISRMDSNGRAYIVDEHGEPRLRKGAIREDDYLPYTDYVADLRSNTDFAGAFEPNGAKGGDARPTDTKQSSNAGTVVMTSDGVPAFR